jgi:DNA replicative helicase MCM subunit Mcm2 (Cdc46/Mcm family)
MTSERRIFISPVDVLSIGFECPHCGATYFVPIDKLDRDLPRKCQNCNEPFLNDAPVQNLDYSDLRALGAFITFFKDLRRRTFSSSIRFEIQGESTRKEMEQP